VHLNFSSLIITNDSGLDKTKRQWLEDELHRAVPKQGRLYLQLSPAHEDIGKIR
jgi:hypothetical protein